MTDDNKPEQDTQKEADTDPEQESWEAGLDLDTANKLVDMVKGGRKRPPGYEPDDSAREHETQWEQRQQHARQNGHVHARKRSRIHTETINFQSMEETIQEIQLKGVHAPHRSNITRDYLDEDDKIERYHENGVEPGKPKTPKHTHPGYFPPPPKFRTLTYEEQAELTRKPPLDEPGKPNGLRQPRRRWEDLE